MHVMELAVLLAVGHLVGARAPVGERLAHVDSATMPQLQAPQIQFDVARFDTLTARVLGEIFDGAAARGLPTAPLINRALEGAARRVGGARILAVVRAYTVALSDARDALGIASTVAELEGGASALRAGVDARTITLVRSSRPSGSVETPLMVLTDIVSRGVPAATAREAVTTLSRMPKNSDEALMGLQLTVAKNSVRGPGMALDALHRYVRGTVSGSVLPSIPATTDRKPIRPPTS